MTIFARDSVWKLERQRLHILQSWRKGVLWVLMYRATVEAIGDG